MQSFPPEIEFKFSWRNYQQRALDELTHHLDDNHLHIIAPPGSGKTILGLEVTLRLNKPTLVFAPTVAIRNQWIQRFCNMFLQTEEVPDWISRDIKNPKFLTVSTYQGLHAAFSGTEEVEDDEEPEENGNGNGIKKTKVNEVLSVLEKQNIGTIVVDEAHHLKNSWWESLTEVKKKLNPTIVGLTATPPYDVSHLEWQRYIELNGPVDAEISVPELVAEGDLCPHQDYIYFSHPTKEESEKIDSHRDRIKALFQELKEDSTLIKAIEGHPIIVSPKENLDWIYTNLEYYSASLIFLNSVGKVISQSHIEVVGDKKFVIPALNYDWIEVLLTFFLYKDQENFKTYETHQEVILNKLKRNGAIERKSISFKDNSNLSAYLRSSISKLQSIQEITGFEFGQMKDGLRMVILSDFIRKEFLVKSGDSGQCDQFCPE